MWTSLQARATLKIKELQDHITALTVKLDNLGAELDRHEDAAARQRSQMKVRAVRTVGMMHVALAG